MSVSYHGLNFLFLIIIEFEWSMLVSHSYQFDEFKIGRIGRTSHFCEFVES